MGDASGNLSEADYYEIVATDFAGNVRKKTVYCKLPSVDVKFKTSIDRSSYE